TAGGPPPARAGARAGGPPGVSRAGDGRSVGALDGAEMSRPAANWFSQGQGEALLLINGWTASGIVWPTAWLDELAVRYRVIRLDNRGTGWSRTAPAPFTIAD